MFPSGFPKKTKTRKQILLSSTAVSITPIHPQRDLWHLLLRRLRMQGVQITQSNSQLLHKRTFPFPLTCYAFPSHCLVLAPTPVWCLKRGDSSGSKTSRKLALWNAGKLPCYLAPWIRPLQVQTHTSSSTGMGGRERLIRGVKHGRPLGDS